MRPERHLWWAMAMVALTALNVVCACSVTEYPGLNWFSAGFCLSAGISNIASYVRESRS